VPTLLSNVFNFGQYQLLIAGVLLTITAVANPDGMTKEMGAGLTKLRLKVMARTSGADAPAQPGTAPSPGEAPVAADVSATAVSPKVIGR
jgi:hypothetical protein